MPRGLDIEGGGCRTVGAMALFWTLEMSYPAQLTRLSSSLLAIPLVLVVLGSPIVAQSDLDRAMDRWRTINQHLPIPLLFSAESERLRAEVEIAKGKGSVSHDPHADGSGGVTRSPGGHETARPGWDPNEHVSLGVVVNRPRFNAIFAKHCPDLTSEQRESLRVDLIVGTLVHEGYSVMHHKWDPSKSLEQNIACWEVAEYGAEVALYTALIGFVSPYNFPGHLQNCLSKVLADRETRQIEWQDKCNN